MGFALSKLVQWKTLPYSIIGEFRLMELLNEKKVRLAKELQVSEVLSHSLLLKNSWDEAEAKAAYETPNYVETTFGVKIKDGAIVTTQTEESLTCTVCRFEYEGDKLIMKECGHDICEECFVGYLT